LRVWAEERRKVSGVPSRPEPQAGLQGRKPARCAMEHKLAAGIGEKDEPNTVVPRAFDDGERLAIALQVPEVSRLADRYSVGVCM